MDSLRFPRLLRRLAPLPVSAALVAALPKCPVCLVAMLSAVGISVAPSNSALLVLSGLVLCFPLGMLAMRAGGRRHLGPFLVGVVCALLIIAGKLPGSPRVLLAAGIAGLTGAFVWRGFRAWKLIRQQTPKSNVVFISGAQPPASPGLPRPVTGRR